MKKKTDCQLTIPKKWTPVEPSDRIPPLVPDAVIYHTSLFAREFISTLCLLLLRSRLNSSLFIAGPIVTFYISIVFRRPLNNIRDVQWTYWHVLNQ